MPKTVFLLGAGASVADVATKPQKDRPPLDRGFFEVARHAGRVRGDVLTNTSLEIIRNYVQETYGRDIFTTASDSLEGVMALLYPDLFNERLERRAMGAFRALLALFTSRLASTTNGLRPTQKRFLYRMVSRELARNTSPADITIVTFNQDLQVEKTLDHLSRAARWKSRADTIFSFPGMYSVASGTWAGVSAPSGRSGQDSLFRTTEPNDDCIRVLKLHGSLNWYSTHITPRPTRAAMFNPRRRLSVTQRRTIVPTMSLKGGKRRVYTLPVVVPPVNHKSSVLHEALGPVWALAEQRLIEADHIVVFGYSCPQLDFESQNLLVRAQQRRADYSVVSVIDPSPAVATRYIEMLSLARLHYYAGAQSFLADGLQ